MATNGERLAGRREQQELERLERLKGIQKGIYYLNEQCALPPQERDNRIISVAEGILDVFYNDCVSAPNREGGNEIKVGGIPRFNLGGGMNVIAGIAPFSHDVTVITRIGQIPPYEKEMLQLLHQLPENTSVIAIPDLESKNAVKERYESKGTGQVIGGTSHTPRPADQMITMMIESTLTKIATEDPDIAAKILMSDYGRGLINKGILAQVSMLFGNAGRNIFIDPRPTKKPGEDEKYNVTGAILKPNRTETEALAGIVVPEKEQGDFQTATDEAGQRILDRFPLIRGVLSTYDKDGTVYYGRDGTTFRLTPAFAAREVINPSGCGDITMAVTALTMDTFPFKLAVDTAMAVATIAAEEQGTSVLSSAILAKTMNRLNEEMAQ